jgi:N utilization substance protein A
MTPEELEEIPGIGEKTLEKISVAVRHYFGQFEEGEAGDKPEGEAEVLTAPAAVDTSEAGLENAAEVLQESESVTAEQAEEALEASEGNEALAEQLAEEQNITAEELAIENVSPADAEESEDEGGA